MPRKITPQVYKEHFKTLYPDYELLSDYNGDKNYIEVRCKKDGNVWKTKPNWLKQGIGCKVCYHKRRGKESRKSIDTFIKQAKEIHGDKYDYSKVDYKDNKTKVTIICPKHGEFHMSPNKHISLKQNCPKCASEQNGIDKRLTLDTFVKRSKLKHGDKYDYSKVEYVNVDTPVIIVCPKHGEFKQTPYIHMKGYGCPRCRQSLLENIVRNFLTKKNIVFEEQKRFKWLSKQSLDFYLPEHNIAIECQGIQHYNKNLIRWENFNYELILKRDNIKQILCKQNDIDILYFSNDKSILNSIDLYTKENTATNLTELLSLIEKHRNIETLFESIVKNIIN
jgi:hypothetical protein